IGRVTGEELRVVEADVFGLHLEDGDFVDAAAAAAEAALEAIGVLFGEFVRLPIHLLVQLVQLFAHPRVYSSSEGSR
ncbi:MAG: hypothetical protein HOC74_25415, partial [Gemmatimonadetes bacterium]|nr:hypothetical protein [Gemmatimonadota bacterium]